MYLLTFLPPFVSSSRLASEDVHTDDAVLARDALLARAAECVEPLPRFDLRETHVREYLDELSLRESTGDSPGPEVDVPPDRFGELVAHDNVCVEEPAARLEDAEDLAVRNRLVRREVQDPVRDHHVHARVLEGQRHGVSQSHLDVVEPC